MSNKEEQLARRRELRLKRKEVLIVISALENKSIDEVVERFKGKSLVYIESYLSDLNINNIDIQEDNKESIDIRNSFWDNVAEFLIDTFRREKLYRFLPDDEGDEWLVTHSLRDISKHLKNVEGRVEKVYYEFGKEIKVKHIGYVRNGKFKRGL